MDNNIQLPEASALHQTLIDQLKQNIPEFILTSKIEEVLERFRARCFCLICLSIRSTGTTPSLLRRKASPPSVRLPNRA